MNQPQNDDRHNFLKSIVKQFYLILRKNDWLLLELLNRLYGVHGVTRETPRVGDYALLI